MNLPRSILFAAVTLALAAQGVWAVEGDIVFERKERPAGAQQPATTDSQTPERKPDQDIVSESESKFYPPATFPHWTHTIRYRCLVCHPRIFPMEAGSTPVVGTENHKEKSCGRCHNGRNAFDTAFATCGRCHISREEKQ